jgi:uncharacterized lipoprotein NlpE involved in copper resistance
MKQKIIFIVCLSLFIWGCQKKSTNQEENKPSKDSVSINNQVDTIHTSQNSLDWAGEYKGTLPCDDCDGIEMSVMLNSDSTFVQTATYIGKGGPYVEKGKFSWDKSGQIITLKYNDNSEAKYLVGENTLSLLNAEGEKIEGNDYVLKK